MSFRLRSRVPLRGSTPDSFRYSVKRTAHSASLSDIFENDPEIRCSTPVEDESQVASSSHDLSGQKVDFETVDYDQFDDDGFCLTPIQPAIADDEMREDLSENSDGEDFSKVDIFSPALWESNGFEMCRLTVEQFSSLLVSLQVFYKLPDSAMQAMIGLFRFVFPTANNCPKTYASVIKHFEANVPNDKPEIVFVCSGKDCSEILISANSLCPDQKCSEFGKGQRPCTYSVMNIRQQLERICQCHFHDMARYKESRFTASENEVGDIITGSQYKTVVEAESFTISLIISSDGANAFNVSDSSLWPMHAMIAELPPRLRVAFENAVILGFWVGTSASKKPDWDLFQEDVNSQLRKLEDGFLVAVDNKYINVKVKVIAATYDLPAVASAWYVKQFNGAYGCIACLAPGQQIENTPKRIWPVTEAPKKDSSFYRDAYKAISEGATDYYGVMGISPLSSLGTPADLHVFDPMHLLYRGVGFLILRRIFENKPGRWRKLITNEEKKSIDDFHKNSKFPHEFQRTVQPLSNLLSFKASEIKNLLAYTLLAALLPYSSRFIDEFHWIAMYVEMIRITNQRTISERDIKRFEQLIKCWRGLLPDILDDMAQTYSTHAIEHLPDQLRRFGAAWAISTFFFESCNGQYCRLIKSGTGILNQLNRRCGLLKESIRFIRESQTNNLGDVVRAMFPKQAARFLSRKACNTSIKSNIPAPPEWSQYLAACFGSERSNDLRFGSTFVRNGETFYSTTEKLSASCLIHGTRTLTPHAYKDGDFRVCAQFFIFDGSEYFVAGHLFHITHESICDVCDPPQKPELLEMYNRRMYGKHFKRARLSESMCLLSASSIMCKMLMCPSDKVHCFLTDVLPFEHD